jgi:hypothetical protein
LKLQYTYRELAKVLEQLEFKFFTGRLLCETTNHTTELYFYKGRLIRAQAEDSSGAPVLYELLSWLDGTLTIEQKIHALAPNIDEFMLLYFKDLVSFLQMRGLFYGGQSKPEDFLPVISWRVIRNDNSPRSRAAV